MKSAKEKFHKAKDGAKKTKKKQQKGDVKKANKLKKKLNKAVAKHASKSKKNVKESHKGS